MNDQVEKLSNGPPLPPIPQRLREMLKDYPGHLERLQEVLNTVVEGPMKAKGSPDYTFERATWRLEGRLETFIHEAQDELEAAQASSDAEAIARAKEKLSLMRRSCSSSGGMKLFYMNDLSQYLETNKEALR